MKQNGGKVSIVENINHKQELLTNEERREMIFIEGECMLQKFDK